MLKWFEKNRISSINITVIIAIIIFLFSSVPGNSEGIPSGTDLSMIYHISIFFLFSFFLFASIKGNRRIKPEYIAITLGLSIAYAILDEAHQIFAPFRVPSMSDILLDLIGSSLALITYIYLKRKD